jgi:hypothetical protein
MRTRLPPEDRCGFRAADRDPNCRYGRLRPLRRDCRVVTDLIDSTTDHGLSEPRQFYDNCEVLAVDEFSFDRMERVEPA